MFERKNQSILSKHFNKMVDRDSDHGDDDSDDDFITLKRADHELEGDSQEHTFVSKRQEKLAGTKKAVTKYGTRGTKLVFDDEGEAHELYEMKSAEEVFKGADEVKEAGRKFAESERSRLKDADVLDKAEAKEKKREKKRKRKEREREVRASIATRHPCITDFLLKEDEYASGDDFVPPILAPVDDDDGYVSPEFDLPSESEEDEAPPPPAKRAKPAASSKAKEKSILADDEALVLQLLRGR